MRIVNPSATICDNLDLMKVEQRIETCGRICYKSEAKIGQGEYSIEAVQIEDTLVAGFAEIDYEVTPPDPPTISAVSTGDARAAVSFTRNGDGGSPITGYAVTSNPGGIIGSGSESPITVTGLTNGTDYTFTAQALNDRGSSLASALSNPVTPVASPVTIHVDYTLGQIAGAAETVMQIADRSWTEFDPDGAGPLPVGKHLNAVALYVSSHSGYQAVPGAVIDNPARRTIQTPALPYVTRPTVQVRTLFLQAPWLPSTAYTLGEKVSGFSREVDLVGATIPAYPNTTGYWTCTVAGTSGTTEPAWTPRLELSSGWEEAYTLISPPSWPVNYEGWRAENNYLSMQKPWASTFTGVSVSPGGALLVRQETAANYYITLPATDSVGPQYLSRVYDPARINQQIVATKVLQDGGVTWTYTEDKTAWAFEGIPSGTVTVKEAVSGRYVAQGDTYLRVPQ